MVVMTPKGWRHDTAEADTGGHAARPKLVNHKHILQYQGASIKKKVLIFFCKDCGKVRMYRRNRIHAMLTGNTRFRKKDQMN